MVVPHTAWSLTSSIQVSALVFKVSGNACGVRLGQGHTMGHCPRTRGDKQSWVRQVSNHSIPRLKSLIRCCCSVTQSCSTFCDPMDCSTPGFPVLHCLSEFAQTHVDWVSDAIQSFVLCCPLLPLPSIFPSIRVFSNESDSASILSVNIKDWFPVLPGQGSQPHIKGKVSSEPGFLFLMPSLTSPLTVRVQLIRSLASVREEQKENPPVGSSAFSPTFSD